MFISYKVADYEKYFRNIIDINVDQADEEFLIWSDSIIKSIDFNPVEYSDDQDKFIDRETLSQTHYSNIEVGDAIKVKLQLPCGIPSHKIVVVDQNDAVYSFIPLLSGGRGSMGLIKSDNFVWGAFSFL